MYNYKDLTAWKYGIQLMHSMYRMTNKFPYTELFSLTQRIRDNSVSMVSYIAKTSSLSSSDGHAVLKKSNALAKRLRIRFLEARNAGYISVSEFENMLESIGQLQNMIRSMQNRIV